MLVLSGPFLAACALLVVAGLSKLRDPSSLVRALRTAHLPVSRPLVRAVAAGEVALGVTAAATGAGIAVALVAGSYVAFTAFVLLARSRGGVLASCGCFGKADTPPTLLHAVLTGAVAALVAAVAVDSPGDLAGVLEQTGAALLPATTAVAVGLYLALSLLPMLSAPRPAVAAR